MSYLHLRFTEDELLNFIFELYLNGKSIDQIQYVCTRMGWNVSENDINLFLDEIIELNY
jgi:hypothetical protein